MKVLYINGTERVIARRRSQEAAAALRTQAEAMNNVRAVTIDTWHNCDCVDRLD